jgi:hypothetical protein
MRQGCEEVGSGTISQWSCKTGTHWGRSLRNEEVMGPMGPIGSLAVDHKDNSAVKQPVGQRGSELVKLRGKGVVRAMRKCSERQ